MSELLLERPAKSFEHVSPQEELDLDRLNAEFAEISPEERIVRSGELFGDKLVLATTFGPTAPVLLKAASEAIPDIPVVNVRHGYETQATLDHAGRYWARFGLNLHIYRGPKLEIPEENTLEFDDFQRAIKVEPFQQALNEHSAEAYFSGAMSWQADGRETWQFIEKKGDIYKINPLLDVSEIQVDEFFAATGLPRLDNEDYYDPAKGLDQRTECQLNTTEYLAPEPKVNLTIFQTKVLGLISLGQTEKQIARRLQAPAEDIKRVKKVIPRKFGVTNLAAGVGKAIESGLLGVQVKTDEKITTEITALELGILQAYSEGGSEREIAEIAGSDIKATRSYEKEFLKKIGAWSRPHAVRRGFELGVL